MTDLTGRTALITGSVRGVEAIAVRADASSTADLDRLFARALERFGSTDVVVANAGVEVVDQTILEASEEQFDRLFAINTEGAFFTLQKAAEHVADDGRILHIGSSSTSQPASGVGLYGASKMAARYVVSVLALEVGQRGVSVNSIIPTAIEGAGCSPTSPTTTPSSSS